MSVLLVINAGSSSLKFAGFEADTALRKTEPHLLFRGLLDGFDSVPHLAIRDASGVIFCPGSRLPRGRIEAMRDVELYRQLLGVVSPWTVNRVELSVEDERVDVWVEHASIWQTWR